MMVVPVAAAAQLAASYRATLWIGAGVGASSAVVGLLVSHYRDYAPASAIVLVAIVWYLGASGWRAAARKASKRSAAADLGV
jgi:zinc transport system permease protein